MNETLIQGAYIIAGLLFILALAGLSKHETAVQGNKYGIVGTLVVLGIALLIFFIRRYNRYIVKKAQGRTKNNDGKRS